MFKREVREAFRKADIARSKALFGNLEDYFALSADDWIRDIRRTAGIAFEAGHIVGDATE